MLTYYLDLAFRSLKRSRMLTLLMVLAIALGIGACMTTLTVLHVLSGDPLPGRSGSLYYPQLDPRDMEGYAPGVEPADQLSWTDGMNLLRARRGTLQALMTGGMVPLQPAQTNIDPFHADARYTTADFFPMFGVPFQYGSGWGAAEDDSRARVVVISSELNNKLFGGQNSVGKTLRLQEADFRIIGVLGNWRPDPHFYDLYMGAYASYEEVYLPLSTSRDLHMQHDGSLDCWGDGGGDRDKLEQSTCVWLQFWVQLDNPAAVASYKSFLQHYAEDQHASGRFARPAVIRLRNVQQWLDFKQVVPSDTRLQAWLALGFLVVCLINTVGLMLAKFMRRAGELGVRRALGASRRALFGQLLLESGVVGFVGGVLGLLLAFLGLWLVRQQPSDYAKLAHMDSVMLLATFVIAIVATMLAGLLPAWRACHVAPALQLKAQ
ncbi:ABC transporter permease [Dyella caseinilytica]|uniref:ABC transporter permease n=1 Tax=Dyella caseinilytica TaxID=1849581 RepID=A0ABX7GR93_9GAMM|nr:ABC transporter permease [Dyella caseinilytica]QRN52770.1 ABC transporter permease [Dyella caseinilytica]GGA08594.1 ABC transporter ATP-binding protein [Dyella caseinilytica]